MVEEKGFRGCKKLSAADNHPGAKRATPPKSGGVAFKRLPSADEEGRGASRRGGAAKGRKAVP